MKKYLIVMLILFLLPAFEGCSFSARDTQDDYAKITHAQYIDRAEFSYNKKVFTVSSSVAKVVSKEEGYDFTLSLHTLGPVDKLPDGYAKVGTIDHSVLKEVLSEDSNNLYYATAYLNSDFETYFDDIMNCEICANVETPNFIYLKYDGKYLLCVDYLVDHNWIVYQHNLYVEKNSWNDDSEAKYYYQNYPTLISEGQTASVLLKDASIVGSLTLADYTNFIPDKDLIINTDSFGLGSDTKVAVSQSGDYLYLCGNGQTCSLDSTENWSFWLKMDEDYYKLG